MITYEVFQLTPSRRATGHRVWQQTEESHFNSRPHGGRPDGRNKAPEDDGISTHALTEGDVKMTEYPQHPDISTHALTEGDAMITKKRLKRKISTHALTEGDQY